MHVGLRLRAAALQNPLSPRPEAHLNLLPWPLPAISWVPQQSLPCAVHAGVVWVLPDASLVTPGDLRSHLGARPPQTPPRVRFPGMTLSHRPCPRPRKEEAAGPALGTVLPTHNPGCHQSHRIPTLLLLGLSFPSGAMAGQGSGVSWLAFDGWESKDLPRVSPRFLRAWHPSPVAARMPTRRWAPGTQCMTKCENSRPKPGELAFRKGDMVTILEACEEKGWYRAKHHGSGQEGLLAATALRQREALSADPKLSLMPWFHGKISGQEAVQQLQPPEDGLFLVRESARHPGDYVLCVSFGRDVIHYRVLHRDGHLTIDEAVCFCNLMDMVEHYTKDKGAICTKLVKPKRKQGAKSAEEELAKAGWLLDLQHLTLGAQIGEGEFGAVLQGEYLGQKVAVKNIKCDVTAQAFLDETAVMTKLQHRNLVRLLGVILHHGLYIVMEHVSKGNLVNFLRTRGRALVSTSQLLRFSLHVAEGMEYLEGKKLVHRDLAARNILVSEDLVAKVSDFGLAKAERKGLDSSRLPVKWSAPEALKNGRFSSKSDVWSFGVLLWEVFSYGRAPYPKMSLKEVSEAVEKGYRMEPPDGCPASVHTLMGSCWEAEPARRPPFRKIAEKLGRELRSAGTAAPIAGQEVEGSAPPRSQDP
ncbi:megakaryocyte-associated tyrosine-protein kinase isoform X2 [Alexandromys fortis]|uniref:megakaryocyte-associated tyrosine-protein kinase isoform X2 n=2 Tax=Alexandromys fortis TaxID=100897 RepID=UPI002152DC3E|nr:megakaryocyte-associated tyrosine-protein kinase isoform X2 [Microtus fortis]